MFEQFQRQVPFVALTTLQMRDSVENDTGTLDTFVMEWQTFANTESLQSGYQFIPFGVRHDNPLYAVGDLSASQSEALASLRRVRANVPSTRSWRPSTGSIRRPFESTVEVPSGSTLIDVQNVWKDKKDGGRPVATVFVVDVSGSMEGERIQAVQEAMLSAREFIKPETQVGVVEFSDIATKRLDIAPFDLNQQARYAAIAEDLEPRWRHRDVRRHRARAADARGPASARSRPQADPRGAHATVRPPTGLTFDNVDGVIEGLRIPIYTVGFEADLDELGRVSSLVEAASIDASADDVEFKIAALFNAGG